MIITNWRGGGDKSATQDTMFQW